MKYLAIIIFLIATKTCSSQNLKMTIELDSCINTSLKNRVTFVIENQTDSDIWIINHLLIYHFEILNVNGGKISRVIKSHSNVNKIGRGLYSKIPTKSKIKIDWVFNFFDDYEMKSNGKYYLRCRYELNTHSRNEKNRMRNTEFNLPKLQFEGKSNIFKICKL